MCVSPSMDRSVYGRYIHFTENVVKFVTFAIKLTYDFETIANL